MKGYYQHVKGTTDFFSPQTIVFQEIIEKAKKIFRTFGYEEIMLPLLEETSVFVKSVGELTDIVERQMFKIEGKDIVLRPEGTAQVVRFFIEHTLWKEKEFHKFFYIGPMFRGERPQRGRLRQFHHIGGECLGSNLPYLDAEVIKLALLILKECGIGDVELKINSLGCQKDKERWKNNLIKQLQNRKKELCPLCRERLERNPLRVLDCKEKGCRRVVETLKRDVYLCSSCQEHFKRVLYYLDKLKISYDYSPILVRGLDYYTNTVFEIVSHKLGSQDACGAGGRYNSLVKSMGGPDIPAIGFALGIERMMLLLGKEEKRPSLKVFVAYRENCLDKAIEVLNSLRERDIPSQMSYLEKSLKAQLRLAQKSGAEFTIIIGEEELKEGFFTLRDMRKSQQEKIGWSQLLEKIKVFEG